MHFSDICDEGYLNLWLKMVASLVKGLDKTGETTDSQVWSMNVIETTTCAQSFLQSGATAPLCKISKSAAPAIWVGADSRRRRKKSMHHNCRIKLRITRGG